jgi:hypothetical protein
LNNNNNNNNNNIKGIYSDISLTHHFFPNAFETFGPINQVGSDFISDVGYRQSAITDDPRETCFLFQRLSIAIQRFNFVFCTLSAKHHLTGQDTPRIFNHHYTHQYLSSWESSTKGGKNNSNNNNNNNNKIPQVKR